MLIIKLSGIYQEVIVAIQRIGAFLSIDTHSESSEEDIPYSISLPYSLTPFQSQPRDILCNMGLTLGKSKKTKTIAGMKNIKNRNHSVVKQKHMNGSSVDRRI